MCMYRLVCSFTCFKKIKVIFFLVCLDYLTDRHQQQAIRKSTAGSALNKHGHIGSVQMPQLSTLTLSSFSKPEEMVSFLDSKLLLVFHFMQQFILGTLIALQNKQVSYA